jgi:hypothetical protein
MSHWTKIQLKLTDEQILIKALKRMGVNAETGNFKISQYGQTSDASVRVDNAIGFVKAKDGTFSMVGDFYHSQGAFKKFYGKNDQFQRELTTAYGIEDAKQKLSDYGGWEITENEEGLVGADGMIRMVAVNYG